MFIVNSIQLSKKLLAELVNHAQQSYPYESIAILGGAIKNSIAYVESVFTPENIDKSTTSFTVDAMALLAIYTEIEKNGKHVVGIYHTHPAAAYPSIIDKEYMQVNPYVWLISSTTSPSKPKGYFLLENGEIKEVKIIIKD